MFSTEIILFKALDEPWFKAPSKKTAIVTIKYVHPRLPLQVCMEESSPSQLWFYKQPVSFKLKGQFSWYFFCHCQNALSFWVIASKGDKILCEKKRKHCNDSEWVLFSLIGVRVRLICSRVEACVVDEATKASPIRSHHWICDIIILSHYLSNVCAAVSMSLTAPLLRTCLPHLLRRHILNILKKFQVMKMIAQMIKVSQGFSWMVFLFNFQNYSILTQIHCIAFCATEVCEVFKCQLYGAV